MKSGRELDAEVALVVAGWYWGPITNRAMLQEFPHLAGQQFELRSPLGSYWYLSKYSTWHEWANIPRYSTSIADAMRMVEWLNPSQEEYNAGRLSCRFIMRQQDDGTWDVEARSPFLTSYGTPGFAQNKSLPEAICRAALAAIE